jgi:AbrB family looped-hinge helix DNA binding protein
LCHGQKEDFVFMGHGFKKGTGHGFGHPHGFGQIRGTTIINERGQIVVPADARKAIGVEPGDRLVVFGNDNSGMLVLVKSEYFNEFADFMMSKLDKLRTSTQDTIDRANTVHDADIPDDAENDDVVDVEAGVPDVDEAEAAAEAADVVAADAPAPDAASAADAPSAPPAAPAAESNTAETD